MKKSSPLVIIIPLFVVIVVIGGALGYYAYVGKANQSKESGVISPPSAVPKLSGEVGTKPNQGFAVPTPTPKYTSDLSTALQPIVQDDGGVLDFSTLAADIAKL